MSDPWSGPKPWQLPENILEPLTRDTLPPSCAGVNSKTRVLGKRINVLIDVVKEKNNEIENLQEKICLLNKLVDSYKSTIGSMLSQI